MRDATLMHKFLNAILVLAVLVSGFVLYSLEHATRGTGARDRRVSSARLREERESIKLLNAEWSSLTRPDRLQALANEHLGAAAAEGQARS